MTADQFRQLLERDSVAHVPPIFDCFMGALAENAGFTSLYLGGYSIGASYGKPEPLLSRTEITDAARRVTESTDLPLLVDMETGFGDPSHVYHAIEDYASAGVAAVHVEDEVYPKRPSYLGGTKRTTSKREMVQRVEAAVKARAEIDDDIVVVARCDAGRGGETGTFEEAIERANAYYEAGAEATIVFPDDETEMEYAVEHSTGPLVYFQTDHCEDATSVAEVGEIGFDMVVTPISSSIAAAKYMQGFYDDLRAGEEHISAAEFDALDEVVGDSYDLDDYIQIDADADVD